MNERGQWQVGGGAPEIYERELVPAVFGVWAPILVELAQPSSGERIVDVACGTGIVARIAAKRVGPTGAVVGIDLNPGMLSVARSVASTDRESGGPLQWQEASADKLPLPTVHSMSLIASWACSSSLIELRPCAKCAEFLVPKEGSR
jgi:SAM-dependent methyltransferase